MMYLLAGAVALVLLLAWFLWETSSIVPCTLEIESSHEQLHAHLELEGFEPEPGDGVRMESVGDDFTDVPLNHKARYTSTARVTRASLLNRLVVKLTGGTEIHELFEVGFEG